MRILGFVIASTIYSGRTTVVNDQDALQMLLLTPLSKQDNLEKGYLKSFVAKWDEMWVTSSALHQLKVSLQAFSAPFTENISTTTPGNR